jgi:DNA-binding MarR family transcriptional regulator
VGATPTGRASSASLSTSSSSGSPSAAITDLTPATVTQMLDGLGAMGLVERLRSERDRRIVTCSLTAEGRALIAERPVHFEHRWHAALAEFSTEDLTTAAAVIDRLHAMFDTFDTTLAEARARDAAA